MRKLKIFQTGCRKKPIYNNGGIEILAFVFSYFEGDIEIIRNKLKQYKPDIIFCADCGYLTCINAGYIPDVFVGDNDSISKEETKNIKEKIYLKSEKDETDTMYAVMKALEYKADEIIIIGGTSSNLAHTMGNIAVLKYIFSNGVNGRIISKDDIYYLKNSKMILKKQKKSFSVLSYCGVSKGVYIKNAKYELDNYEMRNDYPVGVNNEFLNNDAEIEVKDGELIIIC